MPVPGHNPGHLAVERLLREKQAITADTALRLAHGATQQRYGNQTYARSPSGSTTTYSTYGNQTYIRGSDGQSRICSTYGNQTYCN